MQDVDAALLIAVAILALDADMPFLHLEGPGGQLGEMRFGAGHVRAEHGLAARGQMAVNELQQRPVQVIKVQELDATMRSKPSGKRSSLPGRETSR